MIIYELGHAYLNFNLFCLHSLPVLASCCTTTTTLPHFLYPQLFSLCYFPLLPKLIVIDFHHSLATYHSSHSHPLLTIYLISHQSINITTLPHIIILFIALWLACNYSLFLVSSLCYLVSSLCYQSLFLFCSIWIIDY